MPVPNQMGSTFAERKAAAEGKKSFDAPDVDPEKAPPNSTFAERSKAAKKAAAKADSKAVDEDTKTVENKAVKKSAASKKS